MDREIEQRLRSLLGRVDRLLPAQVPDSLPPGCYRWQKSPLGISYLEHLASWKAPDLRQLFGLEGDIRLLRDNTKAFLAGQHANHAVLTGPRGCGKTTMVQGVAGEMFAKGLVLVRMGRELFHELPQLSAATAGRGLRVLVSCDELSYEGPGKELAGAKAAIDDIDSSEGHILIYVTSNRRRLVQEKTVENLAAGRSDTGEVHPAEGTEERISLADRFGLWIPVFQPNEAQFHDMVRRQLRHMGVADATEHELHEGFLWAEERGSMNGRIASQYARHLALTKRR